MSDIVHLCLAVGNCRTLPFTQVCVHTFPWSYNMASNKMFRRRENFTVPATRYLQILLRFPIYS